MSIQEREEADYEMGCFRNEMEAAFNLGQIERVHDAGDDRGAIQDAVKAGKFVVYREGSSYCPYTDAINGTRKGIIQICDTREDADAVLARLGDDCGDETWIRVEPRPEVVRVPVEVNVAGEMVPF